MKIKSKFLIVPTIILASLFLTSWGFNGHYIISWNMPLSLPAEMAEFEDWNSYLAEHASDPDYRKGDDPTEGPKHYIDIDNYADYIQSGSISQDLDTLIEIYGADFVGNNGYLPWATINTYDSLVSSFKNRDWEKAKFFAADLGHYVADGFMPLHITRNYDGQFTDNKGIHGRFESDMINRFKDEIEIIKTEIEDIDVIEDYIFNYMYENILYVDSIMEADNYGKSVNSNTSSTEYLDAMWDYSKDFTLEIFNAATKAFGSIFYTAWEEAGKPLISTTSIETIYKSYESDLSFSPNPVRDHTTIKFNSELNQIYELSLLNSTGSVLKKITEMSYSEECVELVWNLSAYKPGIYFLLLQNPQKRIAKKILLSN